MFIKPAVSRVLIQAGNAMRDDRREERDDRREVEEQPQPRGENIFYVKMME